MQPYEFLTKNQVEQVHDATMQILQEVGIDFRYPPALEILKKGGARVDGERVFFPAQLVEAQIKKAPAEFTLYARNSDCDVVIGGSHMAFIPGYGAPFVTDLDNGRREGALLDFENFVKLTQASPYQDICSGMVSILTSLTPLVYDERMLGAIIEYARAGQPQLISSLVIAGATGPTTLAGTLALQNAEILAGIVLTQLVREGTPVVFSGSSSNTEMRSGALSIGSPEMAVNAAATAQMARFYNLPVRGGGAVSDAKAPDAQAAYESMMSLLMAQVSRVNFVLHSAGILESYSCMSYEKFIIDDEICGMVKRIKKAYAVNPDTLALDVIKAVGPGGTFEHFRNEFFQPKISNRDNFDTWQAGGSQQILETANQKVKQILADYSPPDLPADEDKDLKRFIEGI